MLIANRKPLVAISFDTVTYRDLKLWLEKFHGTELLRVEPNQQHLQFSPEYQYINLVIKDFVLRQEITEFLDREKLDRFSFVHPMTSVDIEIDPIGVMVGPLVAIYSNCKVGSDMIVQTLSVLGHDTCIGKGSYISPNVVVAGTARIGEYCFIGFGSGIFENITIASNVVLGAHALVRHSIDSPGVYFSPHVLQKI